MSLTIWAKSMPLTMGVGLCGISEKQLSSLFRLPSCLTHKSCPTRPILELITIHPPPLPLTRASFAALCLELRVSSGAGSLVGCLHPHRAGLQGRARSLRAILHQPGLLSPRGCPGDGVHRILNRKSMPSSCYPSVQRWRPSALSYSSSPISAGIKIPERRGGDAC